MTSTSLIRTSLTPNAPLERASQQVELDPALMAYLVAQNVETYVDFIRAFAGFKGESVHFVDYGEDRKRACELTFSTYFSQRPAFLARRESEARRASFVRGARTATKAAAVVAAAGCGLGAVSCVGLAGVAGLVAFGSHSIETPQPASHVSEAPTSVSWTPTPLPHLTTLSRENTLSAENHAMLKANGAEGYVLVECADGRVSDPLPVYLSTLGRDMDDTDCAIDDRGSDPVNKGKPFGACGGFAFTDFKPGKGKLDWANVHLGTLERTGTPQAYHSVGQSVAALCAQGSGVFIAPVVPVK